MLRDVDLKWLWYCLDLAKKGEGFTSPNPMVGSVLVRIGDPSAPRSGASPLIRGESFLIAAGWHARAGEEHAERRCLNLVDAAEPDDVLYVSLEPCCFEGKTGACTDIILEKGVKKVVVGMVDPDRRSCGQGLQLLKDNGVEVRCLQDDLGILNSEFRMMNEFLISNDEGKRFFRDLVWLNRGFISRVEKKRPWITLKCAVSVDGFVSNEKLKNKNEKVGDERSIGWITSSQSRENVHEERGKYDAIVVGSGTVRSDDCWLTTYGKSEHQPWRVVLGGDISGDSKVLIDEFRDRTIVVSDDIDLELRSKMKNEGARVWDLDSRDLCSLLERGYDDGWIMVYVEGGPKVWRSFLDSGLVDQIDWYESSEALGSGLEVGFDLIDEPFRLLEELEFGLDKLKRWVR